jgi:glycine dehydrogenase subunit 1
VSYVLNTPDDQTAMLARIGVSSIEDLFANIPADLRLKRPLAIPPALGEMELQRYIELLAARNRAAGDAVCFLSPTPASTRAAQPSLRPC